MTIVPMPPTDRRSAPSGSLRTIVLHAVADDDGLVEAAPVVAALARRSSCFEQVVVYAGPSPRPAATGAAELEIVHRHLGVGPGSQAERTAASLTAFAAVLLEERPHVVLVAGEGDTALGAALATVMQGISVVRLGAGLRNRDWTQRDEVDRTVADRVADTLLATSHHAVANLLEEGSPESRIVNVGSTRVDLLRRYEARARLLAAWRAHGLDREGYVLVSLEAPESVELPVRTRRLAAALRDLEATRPVLLVRHPSTHATLEPLTADLRWTDTGTYPGWLSLLAGAGAIITDSGAVQEDASALGVRCYTLATTTSRTVTLTHGSNTLLGDDPSAIRGVRPAPADPEPTVVPGWDGEAAERVAETLTINYALTSAHADDG